MTLDAIQKRHAQAAVPRYTSYPAVPHFTADFPQSTYRGWLEALPPAEPVSLYIHVPFCRELCWYCGCNMRLVQRYGPVAEYVNTLLKELALLRDALPGRLSLAHLHFGGGTPTALEPDDLERVMDAVRERFDFTADAELAIESDPRTLTADMVARIGRLGFNRASFGVQEFDERVQRAINRVQSEEMVRNAVEQLRAAGVAAINLDLIYGLPHQSVESIARTVGQCARMGPDRLALFGYAHVPWMAKKQKLIDESALPDGDERAAQAAAAAGTLVAAGYEAIGLDHFALPGDPLALAARHGRLRRNFQGYTSDQAGTLLGLGVTSIGSTPAGFVQNLPGAGPWSRAIESGELPIGKGHVLSDEDRLRGSVIEAIMCQGRVDLAAAGQSHGAGPHWWRDERDTLAGLQADGLVEFDDGVLTLTERGRPVMRVVAAVFDRYLRAASSRHSVAV